MSIESPSGFFPQPVPSTPRTSGARPSRRGMRAAAPAIVDYRAAMIQLAIRPRRAPPIDHRLRQAAAKHALSANTFDASMIAKGIGHGPGHSPQAGRYGEAQASAPRRPPRPLH